MVDKNGGNKQILPSSESDSTGEITPVEQQAGAIADAKRLIREGLSAALATEHNEHASPYASLVTVATEPDGSPILLLSTLAIHTQNLVKNPKACLLFQQTSGHASPLEGGRVSVWGTFQQTQSPRAKRRFLARHPSAEAYADFSDFAFYSMHIEAAHYVGGFGRIRPLTAEDILTDCAECEELIDLEPGFLSHINKDHAKSVKQIATGFLSAPDGHWRLSGLDPDGLDLVCEQQARRLSFDARITTPDEMRARFEDLANEAKGHHHPHANSGDHQH